MVLLPGAIAQHAYGERRPILVHFRHPDTDTIVGWETMAEIHGALGIHRPIEPAPEQWITPPGLHNSLAWVVTHIDTGGALEWFRSIEAARGYADEIAEAFDWSVVGTDHTFFLSRPELRRRATIIRDAWLEKEAHLEVSR